MRFCPARPCSHTPGRLPLRVFTLRLCPARTPTSGADWRTAVRLGQKLDGRRRADLLAKAEKMAVKMRQSFLQIDTSGDSRLDPSETLAMFEGSEAALEPVSVRARVCVRSPRCLQQGSRLGSTVSTPPQPQTLCARGCGSPGCQIPINALEGLANVAPARPRRRSRYCRISCGRVT